MFYSFIFYSFIRLALTCINSLSFLSNNFSKLIYITGHTTARSTTHDSFLYLFSPACLIGISQNFDLKDDILHKHPFFFFVHSHGIVSKITIYHTSSPGFIPGRVRNFNSYLGLDQGPLSLLMTID